MTFIRKSYHLRLHQILPASISFYHPSRSEAACAGIGYAKTNRVIDTHIGQVQLMILCTTANHVAAQNRSPRLRGPTGAAGIIAIARIAAGARLVTQARAIIQRAPMRRLSGFNTARGAGTVAGGPIRSDESGPTSYKNHLVSAEVEFETPILCETRQDWN
ncbi:MAG TPA: hypothetical protein VF800_13650 [Telluria sp.]